jgi:hypothetical protein
LKTTSQMKFGGFTGFSPSFTQFTLAEVLGGDVFDACESARDDR